MPSLRIATRNSPLALWQAEFVKSELQKIHPDLVVELIGFTTRGDKLLDSPLAKIGGKGLFVKELEQAMLEGAADIAVHSMKDVPMVFPQGLELAVICEREDPRDAFVSSSHESIETLPIGAIVGTSSLRRQCQLTALRPDIEIKQLRGNVNTRLKKLDDGQYDAIILAAAGLVRLGLNNRIAEHISSDVCLPAGGQGAIGIECRKEDEQIQALLAPLEHKGTTTCVSAERALNHRLQGGCQVPIACYAELAQDRLVMRALVGSVDGKKMLRASGESNHVEAESLGVRLAEDLLAQGADEILAEVYRSE